MKPALSILAVVVNVSMAAAVYGDSKDVFWRYTTDRHNRPILRDGLEVPDGVNPYDFLARRQEFDGWMTRREGDVVFLAEQTSEGEVPILCLHKISRENNYGLTPERFRHLLRYINRNGWYLIADYQYLNRDFTRVPTGFKPIVMGSDDASYGTLIYQTRGDRLTGKVKRFFGKPQLNRDSMVAILERYARREDNRINFTFYVSFDAVPFRQLDGSENPGFPYPGIPIVEEKIRYLDSNFILGIHSLSHTYAYDMGAGAFARDVLSAWTLLDEYAGGEAKTVQTIAFPFGIMGSLTAELKTAISSLTRHGRQLTGGFDLDDKLASPPGSLDEEFNVSRLNVDNQNWEHLLRTLDSADAVIARREIIWETDTKRLPGSRWSLGANPSDGVWILVRK